MIESTMDIKIEISFSNLRNLAIWSLFINLLNLEYQAYEYNEENYDFLNFCYLSLIFEVQWNGQKYHTFQILHKNQIFT